MKANPIDNESGEVESVEQEVPVADEVRDDGVAGKFGFNSLVGWGMSLGLHCFLVAI